MISQIRLDYDIHTVKFWSDGYASQFRSQYAFYMLTKFDPAINVHWNYFEANNRKGAVDGIGGTVKYAAYSHVLTNRVIMKSPREFAEFANSILPCITVQFVDNDSMVLGHHNECREKATYIPGTLEVHYIVITFSKSTCKLRFLENPMKEKEYGISQAHLSLVKGNYYLVKYEGELWAGQLINPTKSGVIIRCLQKAPATSSIWGWPNKPDEKKHRMEDIRQEIETPSNCGCKNSSLRALNLLEHVPELGYLYK